MNYLSPSLRRAIRTFCKANKTPVASIGMVTVEMKEQMRDRIPILEAFVMIRDMQLKQIHAVPLANLMNKKTNPLLSWLLDLWEVACHKN